LFKARPTRNGQDTIDLVAALLSNVDAFHSQASRLSGDLRGYVGKSTPRTAPPIAFIAKFKAPMPAFGFFDRKTGYIVADRGGQWRRNGSKSAVESN
jgi:hypothetical protein